MNNETLITGFPRIGENRELKKALEKYWAGKSSPEDLLSISSELRKKHWLLQKNKGIDLISCNDFSLYDNMLDTAVMLNAIPKRFRNIQNKLEQYFSMARGNKTAIAKEMTKWFNTNYHYIVPELDNCTQFKLDASKIISEYVEAKSIGITPKINVIGPITFLGLSKNKNNDDKYKYFDDVLPIYVQLLQTISELDDTVYVQFEEPLLVKDPTDKELKLLKIAYNHLASVCKNVKIIVTTYFEHSIEATKVLAKTPIWGLGLDFVYGPKNVKSLDLINDKILVAGIIDGRNIWRNDIDKSLELLNCISTKVKKEQIIVSSSCSMLHVPYSTDNEPQSDVVNWLSFACEKIDEVVLLNKIFHSCEISEDETTLLNNIRSSISDKKSSKIVHNDNVYERMKCLLRNQREGDFCERMEIQRQVLKLPELPTTTIGSFPQTSDIRKLRRDFKNNLISKSEYEQGIKEYIDKCISIQEDIGLDVLVHGEPERNDMVEYFGENLDGFHFTSNGWVQSYGSRCVKPPIIYGDVLRAEPMTVKWIKYAQSKTDKILKGMLTGPVTILNWSFVRDDKHRSEISKQIAVALSEEIVDLQYAGIRIIQVDEAAFKEGYPLRNENIKEYEKWAVESFKIAISTAKKETQIHTHMCYSEFNEIIKTVEAMDADVISIENARSGNELLNIFNEIGYKNEIGPGVYDIHSPRIPSINEIENTISSILNVLPINQIWINPDCGLKTRKWEEVRPALKNMVEAVKKIRFKQKILTFR